MNARLASIPIAFALCAAPGAPAWAVLSVCNRTLDIANVAVALEAAGGQGVPRSEGWWAIAPNRCADVVDEPLGGRRVHLHATDVRGRVLLEGDAGFCTAPRAFRIEGRRDCWLRGHTKGGFVFIDARGDDWTVFLEEPGS